MVKTCAGREDASSVGDPAARGSSRSSVSGVRPATSLASPSRAVLFASAVAACSVGPRSQRFLSCHIPPESVRLRDRPLDGEMRGSHSYAACHLISSVALNRTIARTASSAAKFKLRPRRHPSLPPVSQEWHAIPFPTTRLESPTASAPPVNPKSTIGIHIDNATTTKPRTLGLQRTPKGDVRAKYAAASERSAENMARATASARWQAGRYGQKARRRHWIAPAWPRSRRRGMSVLEQFILTGRWLEAPRSPPGGIAKVSPARPLVNGNEDRDQVPARKPRWRNRMVPGYSDQVPQRHRQPKTVASARRRLL